MKKDLDSILLGRIGGGGGIRTHGTGLAYTHFPGVLLRPLGHSSKKKVKHTLLFELLQGNQ